MLGVLGYTGTMRPGDIRAAEVVLPSGELNETLAFFCQKLGFRVQAIWPADEPREAVVSGHGLRLRLVRDAGGGPGVLRLSVGGSPAGGELRAPNGTLVQIEEAEPPIPLPALVPSLVVARERDGARWKEGRAGMHYRDLLPGRQGGRFGASHIRIEAGGAVPDYVHYHRVRFQTIFCVAGWVRLVYQDQGPPFVLNAGDCVLQPPGIRHRVLECAPGLEVCELSSPAEHETHADPALELPNGDERPGSRFGGQRFVLSRAEGAPWKHGADGGAWRDTGIARACGGAADVRVVRPAPGTPRQHDAEARFHFVLSGRATLRPDGHPAVSLAPKDAFTIPARTNYALAEASADLELLEITLPAGG